MKRALVIFSGGQDSTTCLGWARNRFETFAVTFAYRQKHSIEVEQAKKICAEHKVPHQVVSIDFLSQIADSALLDHGDVNKLNEKGLPSSFVPNRNALFITLAHALAQKLKCDFIVTGVCQTDYSGYPDCRQGFINEIEVALNSGSDERIRIQTPLMNLSKAQIFELAKNEHILYTVLNESHTCYNGDRTNFHNWGYGCGECPACTLRAQGFKEWEKQFVK